MSEATSQRSRVAVSSYLGSALVRCVSFALAYFTLAMVSFIAAIPHDGIPTMWPPSGLALAALLLSPRRDWPAMVVSQLCANLTVNLIYLESWTPSLGYALINGVQAVLAAGLMVRFIGVPIAFTRLREVLGLLGLAAVFSNGVAATLSGAMSSLLFGRSFFDAWWVCWVSDAIGMLLVTPLILSWAAARDRLKGDIQVYRIAECIVLFLGLVAVAQWVFGWLPGGRDELLHLPYLVLPGLMWAALRFGPCGVASGSVLIATLAMWSTIRDLGPFAEPGPGIMEHMLDVQLFLGVASVSALVLAAVFSERRQAEEALRQSEERYRQTMDAALAGIYVIRDLVFDYVNPTMARLFGYTPEEVAGKLSPMDTVVPEQRDLVHAKLIERANGVPGVPLELKCLRKDGTVFDAVIRSAGTIYGGRPVVVGTLIDITERKRAEDALRESEERFRQLAENIHEVFWLTDAHKQQILYASPAYEAIWGRSLADLYREPQAWQSAVHPQDCDRVESSMRQQADGEPVDLEYRILRPDGELRWIRTRAFPVRDSAGEIRRVAGISQDITERRCAEEQMRALHADLAHLARLSVAGEMASGLAHELNQPLAAITTFAEACEMMIASPGPGSETLREALAKISVQSRRAGDIIQRMRNFTRKTEPRRTRVDINALAREMVRFVEAEARQREVKVRLDLVEPLPAVLADPVQIQQVVLNLIRNAIEAMQESHPSERELGIRTLRTGTDAVEIAVCDTGPGLSGAAAERLFHPFFTTKANGMGLGLSISKSIIEVHDGRLWATPNAQRGATFHFTLPTVADAVRASAETAV